jgi:hypothetical protein
MTPDLLSRAVFVAALMASTLVLNMRARLLPTRLTPQPSSRCETTNIFPETLDRATLRAPDLADGCGLALEPLFVDFFGDVFATSYCLSS